jgi:hypothetical protein
MPKNLVIVGLELYVRDRLVSNAYNCTITLFTLPNLSITLRINSGGFASIVSMAIGSLVSSFIRLPVLLHVTCLLLLVGSYLSWRPLALSIALWLQRDEG